MVEALDKMMIERLKLYQQKNGNKLPERILIYRDGVSEVMIRNSLIDEDKGGADTFVIGPILAGDGEGVSKTPKCISKL